ncbi:MAG: hypothetical protein HYT68_01175 [Candidatus Zambryskibacteria bacterium]|nr:hypothetical protein [Candidatus Zambryskibacteria bacterium]
MNKLSEMIWQRGSARQIMREARKRLNDAVAPGQFIGAYVALASAHYSLIGRYTEHWWQMPLALWHWRRALVHARTAKMLGLPNWGHVDVVARVLSKGSRLDIFQAWRSLHQALHDIAPFKRAEMKPHARALMTITLAEIEWGWKNQDIAFRLYAEALDLVSDVEDESEPDRDRQLTRILSALGFFYFEHGGELRDTGLNLILEALELAKKCSRDQEMKIRARARKLGVIIG